MYPWLDDAIGRDATVITASRRLARELRSAFAAQQIQSGIESWVTPPVQSLHDWCSRQLESAAASRELPLVLGDHCSAVLWERCLSGRAPHDIAAFRGFLRQARDAWRKLRDWNVPVAALAEAAQTAEERLFADAAYDYLALLESRSGTDNSGVSWLVARLLADDPRLAPAEVILAGFDRPAPAVNALVDSLRAAGCKVHAVADATTQARIRIASFEDHDAELRAAGAWARNILGDEPQAVVAIVDPGLQNDADRAARLVREGVAPGWQYADAAYRRAVDVSYGRKLADFPAIGVALMIMKWLKRGLSAREVSLLLRSRCVAGNAWAGRSRLELELRELPDRAWGAAELRRFLDARDASADAHAWLRGLDAVAAMQNDVPRAAASPVHWASRFDALLEAWSWPGVGTLTSSEFQLVNRWRELLNELAATAIVTPSLLLTDAVERLATLADDVLFQPQAERGLVALMGTLEAAGMQFDHLWVCGMHAGLWPPAGNPSPLIARRLQKQYGLPDATPADTLLYSRRVFERLTRSAPDVVLSWPASDGNAEFAPSGFLDSQAHEIYAGPGDPGWHAAQFCGKDANLVIAADAVPAVAADETVRGGARTVQRQREEPFAAFAHGRLGIRRTEAIEAGIAPRARGVIVHAALGNLLAGCPSRANMSRWAADELTQRLGAAIDAALALPLRHADETYARLLSLERKRLLRLLQRFVAKEIGRDEFAVVEVEKTVAFAACGVRLKLRIDRIDRLLDGSLLVIDYKTGTPQKLLGGDGEPRDLQLVVYADAVGENVGGIGIINVDSRDISHDLAGGGIDGRDAEDWPALLAAWQAEAHEALRQIAAGDVRVNLVLKAAASRPLAILSRVEELKRAY